MSNKAPIIIVFLLAVAAIVYFAQRRDGTPANAPAVQRPTSKTVEIVFLYSTEKKDWIEAQTEAFLKENPDVSVQLVGKGSLEAAQALVEGQAKPAIWSPADSLVLNLAEADYETKTGSRLIAAEGTADAPQPLVITPLVFVAWEDRAEALTKSGAGRINWRSLRSAVTSNEGWPAVGGKPEWGFVKLGHTDPTRSNSGLNALVSMTYEYYRKTSGLQVGDLLKRDYQTWIVDIEKGVGRFESSTGTFMTDMVRFGPSRFDVAYVYESLAISQLDNAQGRWGNLRVYYPATTLWSDHPAALLQGAWLTEAQKKAARALLAHLRGRRAQEQALAFGFRPADTSVPLKTSDARNPFVRLAQYGVQVDLPPAASPPDAAVVRNLLTMWSRLVGTR